MTLLSNDYADFIHPDDSDLMSDPVIGGIAFEMLARGERPSHEDLDFGQMLRSYRGRDGEVLKLTDANSPGFAVLGLTEEFYRNAEEEDERVAAANLFRAVAAFPARVRP